MRRALAVAGALAVAATAAAAPGSPWPTATPPPAAPASPAASPRPAAKRTPVTKERALEIARKAVAEMKPEATFVVLEKETVEKPFGWVFFYEPKAAATDPGAVVPGAGPLVVHRHDGSTAFLSSSVPPDVAIAEYEKVWARRAKP
jgi:hypothetical protein